MTQLSFLRYFAISRKVIFAEVAFAIEPRLSIYDDEDEEKTRTRTI